MYVVLEGVDGAGKTTVLAALCDRLRVELGVDVVPMKEPPETLVGRTALSYFVEGGTDGVVDPYVTALLMVAARVDLHRSIPWADGKIWISDRSLLTTYVYQHEVTDRLLHVLHGLFVSEGSFHRRSMTRLPDLVVLLRVDPETAIRRARARGKEKVTDDQIRTFCSRYDAVVRMFRNWLVPVVEVDAVRPLDEVVSTVWASVVERFRKIGSSPPPLDAPRCS